MYLAFIKVTKAGAELVVACATDETKLWLSPSMKQQQNPCCGSPPLEITLT